jgi:hypothetical protein
LKGKLKNLKIKDQGGRGVHIEGPKLIKISGKFEEIRSLKSN